MELLDLLKSIDLYVETKLSSRRDLSLAWVAEVNGKDFEEILHEHFVQILKLKDCSGKWFLRENVELGIKKA